MHKLIDYICDELYALEDKVAQHGGLSYSEVEYGDMLAHFGKNLSKLEEHGNSYKGRTNARRDSMGRYSRAAAEDMANSIRAMMKDAPDDNIKRDMERLAERMEAMK